MASSNCNLSMDTTGFASVKTENPLELNTVTLPRRISLDQDCQEERRAYRNSSLTHKMQSSRSEMITTPNATAILCK
ncbi:hypothetical protein ACHAWT_001850 [Skeletonema menzelii]